MRRVPFLILFGVFTCGVLAAQDIPKVVTSHVNCAVKPPVYDDWYQQTRLAEGEPYVAPDKRRQQILDNHHRLKLQMTLDEVPLHFLRTHTCASSSIDRVLSDA